MSGIRELLSDNNIPYSGEENPKVGKGWIGVHCPFCMGKRGYHLGINTTSWGSYCWRCGKHAAREVVSSLLGINEMDALKIINKYREGGGSLFIKTNIERYVKKEPFSFPPNFDKKLNRYAVEYIKNRNYDPELIEKVWGIKSIGSDSFLEKINFKNRILAPVMWGDRVVSFQCRDYSGKSSAKYMACPPSREVIPIKSILYGDHKKWGDVGICVEGITDVWRLGPLSFAVFGIEYKTEQITKIADNFNRVIILFDCERQAQKKASELSSRLRACGVKTHIEKIGRGDPGSMSQGDANHLVNTLTRRLY